MNMGSGWGRRLAWLYAVGVVAALCGVAEAQPKPAAAPEDLARLVPPSVVVFVRARNLERLWEETKKSGFADRLKQTKVWQKFVAAEHYTKMLEARNQLRERYAFDVERALLDTIGTEVVLAQVLERAGEGPEQPSFHLLLARAPSAERLKAIADTARRIRTEMGELRSSVEHEYRGYVIYEEAVVQRQGPHAGREKQSCYCLAGNLLIGGERLGPVKAAIDRLLEPDKPSLGDSKRYREALAALPADCAATVYIDAAALLAQGEVLPAVVPAVAKPVVPRPLRGKVRALFRGLDTVVLGLRTAPAVQVVARLRLDRARLDPAVADLLESRAAAHEVWRLMPSTTIAASSVRMDVGALVRLFEAQFPGAAGAGRLDALKRMLSAALGGVDVDREVLARLGPEAAVLVTRLPVPGAGGPQAPVRGVAATMLVQVSGQGDLASRLATFLRTVALTAVAGNNANPNKPKLVLDVERVGDVTVTYVDFAEDHRLKGTLSPCCALVGDFLAVSTSRRAMREVIEATGGQAALGNAPAWKEHLKAFGGKADGLCFLDARLLAAAIGDNREAIVRSRKGGKTEDQVREPVSALVELLGLFEALSVSRVHTPEMISVTATVTSTSPTR